MRPSALGSYLRDRREHRPPDVAPARAGHRATRRSRGLTREEVARLAHISTAYYTRLEQGRARNPSPAVVDALAVALGSTPDEREHLHHLVRSTAEPARPAALPCTAGAAGAEVAAPVLRAALDRLVLPALVTTYLGDVLAWNRAGRALLAPADGDPGSATWGARPNAARLVVQDPWTRALFTDWDRKVAQVADHLRYLQGERPADRRLAGLVGDLVTASPAFAGHWAGGGAAPCGSAVHELVHPGVGPVRVEQQRLAAVGGSGQSLVVLVPQDRRSSAAVDALVAGQDEDGTARRTTGARWTAPLGAAAPPARPGLG